MTAASIVLDHLAHGCMWLLLTCIHGIVLPFGVLARIVLFCSGGGR